MKRVIVSCSLLIFVCVTLPFLWLVTVDSRGQQDLNEYIEDEALHRLVRSLHSAQTQLAQYEQEISVERNHVVNSYFPWIVYNNNNNTLPNFFLVGQNNPNSAMPDDTKLYKSSIKVHLQSHGKTEQAILECIQSEVAKKNVVNSQFVGVERNRQGKSNNLLGKSSEKSGIYTYVTSFSLGVCYRFNKSCSNSVIVQDPLERALQTYTHCKTMPRDLLCAAVSANKVSLRQWILTQGSLLFQQLVYTPEQCKHTFTESLDSSVMMESLSSLNLELDDLVTRDVKRLPCWFLQKMKLVQMSESVLESIAEYVVNNLENWFSLVGMDFDKVSTVKMFQHVYGLNLSECGKSERTASDIYPDKNSALGDFAHVSDNNRANHNAFRKNNFYDENNLEYLKSDPSVKKALELDYKIYKKFRSIFRIQKQVLFNELK